VCDTKATLQNMKPRFRSNFTVSTTSSLEQGHGGVWRKSKKASATSQTLAKLHWKRLPDQQFTGDVYQYLRHRV